MPKGHLDSFLFVTTGSEAVEAAVKLARPLATHGAVGGRVGLALLTPHVFEYIERLDAQMRLWGSTYLPLLVKIRLFSKSFLLPAFWLKSVCPRQTVTPHFRARCGMIAPQIGHDLTPIHREDAQRLRDLHVCCTEANLRETKKPGLCLIG